MSYDYGLRWTWGKSQRQVLLAWSSIAANVSCYQICCGWQFRLSAEQHTGVRRSQTPAAWNTWFHFYRAVAPYSPYLNPVDYKIWGVMQQHEMQIHNVDELKQRLVDVWIVCSKVLSTLLSMSGESICRQVFAWREDTSNICRRLFQ